MDYCSTVNSHGSIFCDVHPGAAYPGYLDYDHVGAIFNTDGIQPFNSTLIGCLSTPYLWPLANLPPSIRMLRELGYNCYIGWREATYEQLAKAC